MAEQHLIPFLYQGQHLLRTLLGPDGHPWFVAVDVCRVFGIKNVSDAVGRLDDDERGIALTDTLGGVQELLTVCLAGFITLGVRSRNPLARKFRRWVTHEVVPTVLRTGSYGQRSAKDMDKAMTEVRLTIAELRRMFGPREATRIGIELYARLGVFIRETGPAQGELDLRVVGGTDV